MRRHRNGIKSAYYAFLKKYGGLFNILHIKGFAKITGDFPGNTILSDIENFRGDFRQRKPLALKII
jgi:hypothetical protein